jgi:predicted transcriptional regulator
MKDMPSLNLYIDEKTKKQLKQLAEEENRSPSRQVKHMLEFYIKNKDKVK